MSTADATMDEHDDTGMGRESLPEMSLIEHLTELRHRLFVCVIAMLVGTILAWFVSQQIYELLSLPVTRVLQEYAQTPADARLVVLSLTEGFIVYLKVAAMAGLFLASPVVLTQMWLFIAPGLYRRERMYAIPVIFASIIFFLAGAAFGYLVLFPVMSNFFITMGVTGDMRPLLSANALFSFLLRTLLGCALVFEWPVVVFFLARMGMVTAGGMLRSFRYAILIIFVIAAVVTPTPDMATQTILATPMLGLYAVGILVAWVVQPRKKK
ncbi:MAG: twin-arginine translocase subunit TatC [Acidobacteriota bacterium]|jgi:sec-independent protein translocase protein TatC